MNNLAKKVLRYLREEFEDDPDPTIYHSTECIAEELGVVAIRLYNWNNDTGALFHLLQEGLVDRIGNNQFGFQWKASGATIRIQW